MEIQLVTDNSLSLKYKETRVVVNFDGKENGLKKLNPSILLGGEDQIGDFYQINTPGEYERADVLITAYQSGNADGNFADVFEVDIEGVTVLYVHPDVSVLEHSIVDELGIIDVLVLSGNDIESGKKIVNLVDPQIIIPIGVDKEGSKKFMTSLGLASMDEETKLKLSEGDFVNEEAPLQMVCLSK